MTGSIFANLLIAESSLQDANIRHSLTIRQFRVPTLNLQAEDYIDRVVWQDIDRYAPPVNVMNNLSDEQIRAFVTNQNVRTNQNSQNVVAVQHFPCHTQAVERCVKLVTESSSAVCGEQQRDGFIRSRIESRKIMNTFDTKSEYRLS